MSAMTVVIPVWGSYCAKLADCVEDIARQEGSPEIIVVDNASDLPLPPLPPAVRVLPLPERVSVGAARNAGLGRVHTRYVVFVDADDRLLPGTLSFLGETLDRDPELVAAITKHVLWNPRTGERAIVDRSPRRIVYTIARFPPLLALCTLRFNIFPIVGCAALRTDVARRCGGFGDGSIGEDWELCAALAWRGRIRFSRRPGRLYAVENGSLWHRAHDRRTFDEQYERFRRRLFADEAVPRWARLLERGIARLHTRDLDRMFSSGPYRPQAAFDSRGDGHSGTAGGVL
jgi:glycosyltransferase involved in cell wall biosynthesis